MHLPLMLFDDVGPVSNTSSSFVRCFYSLLGGGGERETHFLIGAGIKDQSSPEDLSWPTVLASFEQLAGPVGRGRWGGVLLFVGCDLEYACNVLGVPRWDTHDPCGECRANDSDRPHNNFHPNSPWRGTDKDNDAYIADMKHPLHPLVAHPLFNRLTWRHCMLHMLGHHGVASNVVATRELTTVRWQ